MSWDIFYIGLAEMWANKSKDRSTGVGAIIVGPDNEQRSAGYNGFPRGVDDDINHRHNRPLKYEFTEHAERNAIYNAARMGTPLDGCVMYINWWPLPCPDCARAVIQSGITEVIGPDRPFESNSNGSIGVQGKEMDWQQAFETTKSMFEEAGIKITVITIGDDDGYDQT